MVGRRKPRADFFSAFQRAFIKSYNFLLAAALIVIGLSRKFVDEHFESCRLAGHTWNPYGIKNEETEDHPDTYVCGPPKQGWPEFWKDFRDCG